MISRDDPRFKWLAFGGALFCFLTAFVLASYFKGSFASPEVGGSYEFTADDGRDQDADVWKVYITGAVVRPGVYSVPAGARIDDVVKRAGGFSSDGDPEAINLAQTVEDGAHVKVPRMGARGSETAKGSAATEDRPAADAPRDESRTKRAGSTGNSYAADADGKVNVNAATREELQRLPGIGPALSAAIVDYRDANGRFSKPEDLMKVNGIGKKRLERIRGLVTF